MQARCKAIVLISGGGTNLQSFIDAAKSPTYPLEIAAVISDQPSAYGLVRASNANIATQILPAADYPDRATYDAALADAVNAFAPDLVILAGFMRIIAGPLVSQFAGRMLNIHPALLPKYKGLHTHQRCLDSGDPMHGTTVHFVTAELDAGPAVIQARVPIESDDNAERLAARIQALEHVIYPMAARWYAEGRLRMRDQRAWLDQKPLDTPIVMDAGDLRA